jgi:hypothetical protein
MDKSGPGAGFSPRTSVFPANLHSICFSTIIFTITRGAVPIASQSRIKKKLKNFNIAEEMFPNIIQYWHYVPTPNQCKVPVLLFLLWQVVSITPLSVSFIKKFPETMRKEICVLEDGLCVVCIRRRPLGTRKWFLVPWRWSLKMNHYEGRQCTAIDQFAPHTCLWCRGPSWFTAGSVLSCERWGIQNRILISDLK